MPGKPRAPNTSDSFTALSIKRAAYGADLLDFLREQFKENPGYIGEIQRYEVLHGTTELDE